MSEQFTEQPEAPELKELQQRFDNIHFLPRKDKNGRVVGWQSSAPGRKTIELPMHFAAGADIRKGIVLSVMAEDSTPEDPDSGKFTAVMIAPEHDAATQGTIDAWANDEKTADEADRATRERNIAHQALRRVTGKNMAERSLSDTPLPPGLERVADVATHRTASAEAELDSLLGSESSPVRELIDLRREELRRAIREQRRLENELADMRQQEASILRTYEGKPDGIASEALGAISEQIERIDLDMATLRQSSPEAFVGLNLQELKAMRPSTERVGRIIETPSVRELIDDIKAHLFGNKPVLIYGHLGVGKTELAMYIAREMLEDRPDLDDIVATELSEWMVAHPEANPTDRLIQEKKLEMSHKSAVVISGSKQASLGELYGHQILTLDGVGDGEVDQFVGDVTRKLEQWQAQHTEASAEEISRYHDTLLQAFMSQNKSGTISKFFLGPIYKAMSEGRPMIIDEVNAFRHEVLISLNHILTRKAGDVVNVQQNSGTAVQVKRGYGVMMTGNINTGEEKYVDRQQLDPAFLSRLYRVEMDYLPQAVEGPLDEAPIVDNELFRAVLAKLIDKNGNLSGPEETIERVWDMSKAARVIQDVFAGRQVKLRDSATGKEQTVSFKQGVERGVDAKLNEAVLSMRSINSIIDQWQAEGYRYELDYYLWKEFVGQTIDPSDRAFLYQILHDYFGFFTSEGWPDKPDYGSGGEVTDFRIKAPRNAPGTIEFQGPRDYLPKIYGEVPTRQRYPEREIITDPGVEQEVAAEAQRERLQKLQAFLSSASGEIGRIRTVLNPATPATKKP